MIYFTSDSHWGHTNIIKYCNRPFKTVDHMNEEMIQRWNDVVSPKDEVWHLGDFCMSGKSRPKDYLSRLNGRIHLVRGNHDKRVKDQGFASVQPYYELKQKGCRKIVLMHYPMRAWNGSHKGTWHLFGHVHGSMTIKYGRIVLEDALAMDVGVDCHNYTPISLEKVVKIMEKQSRLLSEKFKKEVEKGGLSNKEIQFRERMIKAFR